MNLLPKNINNDNRRAGPISLHRADSPSHDFTSHLLEEDLLSPAELAEIWAKRAYTLAQEPPSITDGQVVALLVFRLSGEYYGIDVTNVREIYPVEQLTPVPRTPRFVAGVFNARGRILPVIDWRSFSGLPAPAAKNEREQAEVERSKIIVVTNVNSISETTQMEVGLLVDEVMDVRTIFIEEIEAPLTTQASIHAHYIRGVTADLLVILDLDALLNDKKLIVKDELL